MLLPLFPIQPVREAIFRHDFLHNRAICMFISFCNIYFLQNDFFSLEKSNLFALSRQDSILKGILEEAQKDALHEIQQFTQPVVQENGTSNLPVDNNEEKAIVVPKEIISPEENIEANAVNQEREPEEAKQN